MTPPDPHRTGRVLVFIADHKDRYGYPPTTREIAAGVGLLSTSAVQFHLARLIRHGYLIHLPGRARTFSITSEGWHWFYGSRDPIGRFSEEGA